MKIRLRDAQNIHPRNGIDVGRIFIVILPAEAVIFHLDDKPRKAVAGNYPKREMTGQVFVAVESSFSVTPSRRIIFIWPSAARTASAAVAFWVCREI